MTKVQISKSYNSIEFELDGHAGFAKRGPDIVCAGISMATQMTMIGLDEVVHAKYTLQSDAERGYMKIKVFNIVDDATWALVNTLAITLEALALDYPENIQVHSR